MRITCRVCLLLIFASVCFAQAKSVDVSGIVTDGNSGRTIGGASVNVVGNLANPTATDDDGVFVLSIPRNLERVRIRIEKPGYAIREKWVSVSSSLPLYIPLAHVVLAKKKSAPKKPNLEQGPGPTASVGMQDTVEVVHTPANSERGAKTLYFGTTGKGEYPNDGLGIAPSELGFDPPGVLVHRENTPVTLVIDNRRAVTIVRFTEKGFVLDDHHWPNIQFKVALIKAIQTPNAQSINCGDGRLVVKPEDCGVSNLTISNGIFRNGAVPDFTNTHRAELDNSVIQGPNNQNLTISGEDTQLTQNTILGTKVDITKDAKRTSLDRNLIGPVGVHNEDDSSNGANMAAILEAQTSDIYRCKTPCGTGPWPDSLPQDVTLPSLSKPLPSAVALHGSSTALAHELWKIMDQGYALSLQFSKDHDEQALAKAEKVWEDEAQAMVSANLDSSIGDYFSQIKLADNPKDGSTQGVRICNLIRGKVDILTVFSNQLIGADDQAHKQPKTP